MCLVNIFTQIPVLTTNDCATPTQRQNTIYCECEQYPYPNQPKIKKTIQINRLIKFIFEGTMTSLEYDDL